ncbi:spore germination protein GerPB [Chengkuizengella axinellae]|uniref:Spore germination protein GerPB n=1 Tax=Chengkuizengella axinellae TaxID=3064388 RepID=A0ABT9IUJ8_9BACL|nr:spore germination protein GerPB [Chengkuizengella sp. 2205SS18-9]MDP5272505.1 spore germination protein GerPB [Chengkuizengella sp. 2205SS18-9]
MNLTVNQSIQINVIKIGAVTNSSFVQIGSAGVINCLSNLYNTGGFTGPAPELEAISEASTAFVPLSPPS